MIRETGDVLIFRIVEIADGKAVVDANHPLAGQAVRCCYNQLMFAKATRKRSNAGHAHGRHGLNTRLSTSTQYISRDPKPGFFYEICPIVSRSNPAKSHRVST